MKRLHVNLQVGDLAAAIEQYETLLGTSPTFRKPDYAKWNLDEPALSLSVTARGNAIGLDHLGIRFDDPDDFRAAANRIAVANGEANGEAGGEESTTCCYARSDKQWWTDPAGVNWELFVTHAQVDEFGGDHVAPKELAASASRRNACC